MPLTLDDWIAVTDAYGKATRELRQIEFDYDKPGAPSERLRERLNILSDQLVHLAYQYRDGLPAVSLSRCPFSGTEMRHSFDPYGFRGMWWHYHNPVRPEHEPAAGPHFLGLTGGARIVEPVEETEFLVVPGPAVPFVVPRVLRLPRVRAVISSVPVGRHVAFAITYYTLAPLENVRPPTIWATSFTSMASSARRALDEEIDDVEDWDFALTPWVSSEKLAWIDPSDATLTLRYGVRGCPYLAISGERESQCVQYGKVWAS